MRKRVFFLTLLCLLAVFASCQARELVWCYSDNIRTVYFDKDQTWVIDGSLVHTHYIIQRADGSRMECTSNFDAYRREYEQYQYEMDAAGNEIYRDRRGHVFYIETANAPIYVMYRKLLSYYPI